MGTNGCLDNMRKICLENKFIVLMCHDFANILFQMVPSLALTSPGQLISQWFVFLWNRISVLNYLIFSHVLLIKVLTWICDYKLLAIMIFKYFQQQETTANIILYIIHENSVDMLVSLKGDSMNFYKKYCEKYSINSSHARKYNQTGHTELWKCQMAGKKLDNFDLIFKRRKVGWRITLSLSSW